MKIWYVDCFLLMNSALSLQKNEEGLQQMGRPKLETAFTTVVNISLTIQQIYFLNLHNMEVKFVTLLHQRWQDLRLGSNIQTEERAISGRIWKPMVTITEGEAQVEDETQFWRGFGPHGNVLYSEKLTARTYCTTDFWNFPFDTQKCSIKLGSYRFPKEEVELVWNAIPVEILTGVNLRQFCLFDITTYKEIEIRPSGNFTVLVAQFTMKRISQHYISTTICPSFLIISVTYLTFFINHRKINVRFFFCGLNLSLLLYAFHYSSCLTGEASYLKALDIWLILCIMFVLMALLVTFAVNNLCETSEEEDCNDDKRENAGKSSAKSILWINRFSYVLIPACFTASAVLYFVVYVK